MTTGLTHALHDPDNGSTSIAPVSCYNEEENEGERMFRMGVVASVLADRQEAKKKRFEKINKRAIRRQLANLCFAFYEA